MTEYDTFNEIKNEELRTRNRAVVMANIFEDHAEGRDISKQGAALLLGYFNKIPKPDRKVVFEAFQANMAERGFTYGG